MYKNKTFLAVIPARGGSKRLPRKNMLDLAGKPLIAWSIEAGLQSRYLDVVMVSSDDDEILTLAQDFGAKIIKRPDLLASDTSTTFDAIKHAIENNLQYDYIVLLQPTSPLRNAEQIDKAIELLFEKNANAVVSVCEMDHSPLWSNTLPENDDMSFFLREEIQNRRSQDLPIYYRLNGAIYICETAKLLEAKTFLIKNNIFAYKMDKINSIDIDDEIDMFLAENVFKLKGSFK
ncbi:MAG: acylneuraminate cytidylyltransferase family protein [Sulfuricurvum sp.]|jgi:CMP-N,N'-diacetyllegionaminic acid synthase